MNCTRAVTPMQTATAIVRQSRCVCGAPKNRSISRVFCHACHYLVPIDLRARLKEERKASLFLEAFMTAQRAILYIRGEAKGATA